MMSIEETFNKYEDSVFKNLDKENMNKIISFLKNNHCDFINELLEDYLDLFTFEYYEFVKKFNTLNQKYHGLFLEEVKQDMNLLEDFYSC